MNAKHAVRFGEVARRALVAVVAGVAPALLADGAAAQSAVRFTIVPQGAAVMPVGDFGRIAETAPGTYAAVVGGLPSAPALGLTAEVGLGDSPWSLRAAGLWSFQGEGVVTLDCADRACPSILIREAMETRMYAIVGALAFHPDVSLWSIRPLVAVGGGGRGRSFEWSGDELVFRSGDVDLRDGVLHASAGLARPLGAGEIVLEVGDLMGRVGDASEEYRHDVTLSLGYRM